MSAAAPTLAPPVTGTPEPVACPNCGAEFIPPARRAAPICPNCFAARLSLLSTSDVPRPELVVPFEREQSQLAPLLQTWLRGVWLRPAELNVAPLLDNLVRVYLPLWLVDATANGRWQAQLGFDYLVASSQERYQDGAWHTERVTETRVRWEPRAGEIRRRYENVTAPALAQYTPLSAQLGVYDTSRARPVEKDKLKSAFVRLPDVAARAAWPDARRELTGLAGADCRTAAGAQHTDQFVLDAEFEDQHWTLLLVPVYFTLYHDEEGKVRRVLVNGQSGRIWGVQRASIRQARTFSLALGLVALVLLALAVLTGMAGQQTHNLAGLASALFVLTLVMGLLAPVPLIWAWGFNSRTNP